MVLKFKLLSAIAVLCSMSSCSEDDSSSISLVTINQTLLEVDERDGEIAITLNLSDPLQSATPVTFSVSGSARLDGDYTLPNGTNVTIPAESTSAEITIGLLDESTIEENDTLIITLQTSGAESTLGTQNKITSTVIITDNDEPTDDVLQVDLVWDTGQGRSINLSNLDLFVAYDLVLNEDSEIEDFQLLEDVYSENQSGFESVLLTNSLANEEYYIVIYFASGTVDTDFELILNGEGFDNNIATGEFTSDQVEMAYFFGPLKKSEDGISYGRTKRAVNIVKEQEQGAQPTLYELKNHVFRLGR